MTLANRFFQRFLGLQRAYGSFQIDQTATGVKAKGKARTITGKVTEELWQSHLDGITGIGIVPIREDNTCYWGALDIDVYSLDLPALEIKIRELELPMIVCRTKSGGAHIYLFCSEPVPAVLIQTKLALCAKALGYPDTEIFPKQIVLSGPKDVGNWLNSCYFDHDVTNRYAIENGEPITAERFLALADERQVTLEQLEALEITPPFEEFSDGPPCLQYLAKVGFPEGSRNHALFDLGVYYRMKYAEGWEDMVSAANQQHMGPGSFQEVMGIIKSLNKQTYKYKCTDQPISQHCQRGVCAKRKYGVPDTLGSSESAKKKRECILQYVDKPVQCYEPPPGSNDFPHWEFKMHGQKLSLTMDHIRSQTRFLEEYFKHFHRLVLPVEDQRWADTMNELLTEEEKSEMPNDAGPEGQLWSHLESFCTSRAQGKDRQELAMGRPWTDKGRTYFRASDLMKYLDQQHFKAFKETEIWPILRRRDLDHHAFTVKGRCIQCWSVAEFMEQMEPFDTVEIPEEDKPF